MGFCGSDYGCFGFGVWVGVCALLICFCVHVVLVVGLFLWLVFILVGWCRVWFVYMFFGVFFFLFGCGCLLYIEWVWF